VLWLNASYPDQKIELVTAEVWFEDLELEETGVVTVALRRCRRTSRFRPQLSSILEVCKEVRLERAAVPREQAEDATRTCAGCCTEDVAGWVATGEGWAPCPDCRPGRHEAFALTRKSGHTLNATGRNYLIAPLDKATGFPKGRGEA
jgi:hypothetical protein